MKQWLQIWGKQIGFYAFCFFIIWIFFIGMEGYFVPVVISFSLAYACFPIVRALEKRHIRREIAIFSVFFALVLLCVLVGVFIGPVLFEQIKSLFEDLPDGVARLFEQGKHLFEKLQLIFGIQIDSIESWIQERAVSFSYAFFQMLSQSVEGVFSGLVRIILGILSILLVPVVFFYMIRDYEKLNHEIFKRVPRSWKKCFQELDSVWSGYIRGQALLALFLAFFYSLMLWFFGIPFGLLVGLFAGVFSLIPYLGITLGVGLTVFVSLAYGNFIDQWWVVVLVFGSAQLLDGAFLTPRLVGGAVGISPLWAILGVMVFGNLFGFWGIFLAVPLTGTFWILFQHLERHVFQRKEEVKKTLPK